MEKETYESYITATGDDSLVTVMDGMLEALQESGCVLVAYEYKRVPEGIVSDENSKFEFTIEGTPEDIRVFQAFIDGWIKT